MTKEGRRFVWSEEEIEYLKRTYGKVAIEDIGKKLGVSHTTVRLKALELGLHPQKVIRHCVWTKEKLEYLIMHYPEETNTDLASHIGFSSTTIQAKAKALGLTKSDSYEKRDFRRRYVRDYRKVV